MRTKLRKGFTLVELSLAIVLVSVLTIAIMQVAMQIMKIYAKGMTLRSANQVARDISDQLTRDLHAAPAEQVNLSQINRGRLCIGGTSYIWNTTAVLNSSDPKIVTSSNIPIRLARVLDPGQKYCASPLIFTVSSTDATTDLLGNANNDLAIYKLDVKQFISTKPIYTIDYTVGTNDASAVTGSQCKPPTDNQANFDFCTVAEFHKIVRASDVGGA